MAKKKTSKKNSKTTLLDFIVLVLAGGMFGLLALPFMKAEWKVGSVTNVAKASGYDLLNFEANSGVAVCILLLVIFASLLAVASLCKLLADAGIVKDSTFVKISSFATVVMALAVFAMTIAIMIVVPTNCDAYSLGGVLSAGSYAVWVSLIANAVVGLGAFVASVFASKK